MAIALNPVALQDCTYTARCDMLMRRLPTCSAQKYLMAVGFYVCVSIGLSLPACTRGYCCCERTGFGTEVKYINQTVSQ